VHREHVRAVGGSRLVFVHPRKEFGRNRIHVLVDRVPSLVAGDDETGEVLVEQVADDLHQHVGLFIERNSGTGGLLLGLDGLALDLCPTFLQPVDVGADVFFLDALRRGADDHARLGRHDLAKDLLEPLPFGVGQLAADSRR
jgi:hypothetical protein